MIFISSWSVKGCLAFPLLQTYQRYRVQNWGEKFLCWSDFCIPSKKKWNVLCWIVEPLISDPFRCDVESKRVPTTFFSHPHPDICGWDQNQLHFSRREWHTCFLYYWVVSNDIRNLFGPPESLCPKLSHSPLNNLLFVRSKCFMHDRAFLLGCWSRRLK